MVDHSRGLCEPPEKIATKTNLIFNKFYTSNGVNMNVLLLIDEKGDYINLFTDTKRTSLKQIFDIIPKCSNCILIDDTCSLLSVQPGIDPRTHRPYKFTKPDLLSLGGKKSKKNKKILYGRKKTRKFRSS